MYIWAGVTLIRKDGAALAQLRDDKPNIPSPNEWGMLGGRKEVADRNGRFAAVRELFEETNYICEPGDLILISRDEFNTDKGRVVREFYCALYDNIQDISCNEGQKICFLKPAEIKRVEFCDPFHRDHLLTASEKMTRSSKERFV